MQTFFQTHERDSRRFGEHEAYRLERLYTDEITDACERLDAPMDNSFEYTYKRDGELYFQGQPLQEVFETGREKARIIAESRPDFTVEYVRRCLEYDEYEWMKRLAAGDSDDPDCMIVVSPIPDLVLGGLDLGAYDTNRKKTMVRIFERTADGVYATSLSLDGSDHEGLNSIAKLFDETIDEDETSEDILARRFVGWSDHFDDRLKHLVRETYDEALHSKYGGTWFAGQRNPKVFDARVFIEAQHDLVSAHMKRIDMIHASGDSQERRALLKTARYDFAAALTRRMNGDQGSIDITHAGEAARAAGEHYRGDCPDDISAELSTAQLGFGERTMTCPFCGLATKGDPCASRLVCQKCAAEVNQGRIVSRGIGRSNALTLSQRKSVVSRDSEKRDQSRLKRETKFHDDDVIVRYELKIGGADYVMYERDSGQKVGTV